MAHRSLLEIWLPPNDYLRNPLARIERFCRSMTWITAACPATRELPSRGARAGKFISQVGSELLYPGCEQDQNNPERRDIPDQRANQPDTGCVKADVDDARPEIQLDAPRRHPIVRIADVSHDHRSRK